MMTLSLEEAFISLEGATELPSLDTVIIILQRCRKEKNLVYAKRVHMCMHDNGLETHLMLGNYVVPMFVECGSMSDAQQVFYRSVQPNEHSWTSLIQGYVEYGESQNAFNLFQKMQKVSVSPSGYTFLALLKACGQLRCVEKGQAIHLDIAKQGCEEEPFVGNHLVDMYAKCGSLAEAQKVFDELATQDVILWTALVARYVEHGLSEEALNCLEQMQQEGLSPNDVTFVCSLKACGNLGAVDKGRDLHAEIVKAGFEGDIYIGNTLVDFYVKCGSLVEAREVFDELLVRDIVSWTALISGYAEHGLGQEALNCLDKMRVEGMFPNSVTYFSILKACGTIGAIDRGQVFHTAIVKEGFERDHLVSSTLVDFYSKCGLLAEAQAVFDELPVRSVVLWTALIAGYADHGLGEKALSCLAQMQLQGVNADAVTFICTLKVCRSLGVIDRGLQIHAEISKDGFEKDTFVGSTLVDIYAKCGFLAEARAVLEELPVQCVVSWTALIDGYAEHGFGEEALKCLTEMQLEGLSPNAFTFVCGLKASAIIQSIDKGCELHMGIVKNGFEKDLFICSTLVDMYSKCGFLVEAQKIFDEVAIRDVVLWNSLITGYAECSLSAKALDCLKQMQVEGISPNVASWNAILLGCAEHGETDKTLELYVRMLDQALSPDGVTIVSVLKACGNTSAVETGKIIHVQVDSVGGLDTTEVIIATALIDMYSKCGSMRDAQLVFDEMPKRDLMVWTTLLTGYARRGGSERVFDLFEKMREEGIKPDEYTFLSVLTACSHAGHVYEGLKYFEIMSKEFGITPNLIHRNCMVDIVSRAGQLNEAVVMLKKMPFQPDIVTWKTVLAACHKCANVELGRQAFEHVACLDEKDGAAFILMSNIYADAGMWEDARKIETMRLNIQAGKEPGKSWVEIDGLVHKFQFEDTGHFQSKNIHAKLEHFSSRMEEEFDHLLSQGTLYNSKKNVFFKQSEHLVDACGLINTHKETPIRIAVYLWVFDSSHAVMAWISKVEERMILCRDASRLHVFKDGICSCGD